MKLHQIIAALAAESSTNNKLAILKANAGNEMLKTYFKGTLDPFINYWIRVTDLPAPGKNDLELPTLQLLIDTLNNRVVTGHAARDYVAAIMSSLIAEDQIILKNMINRDANCKVAEGLVNKCWKNLIPEFPVMLADKYDAKTAANIPEGKDAIIVQKKEDGGRVAIVVKPDGSVTVYSRNGNILETHRVFDRLFSQYPGKVFDGELIAISETGEVLDRKTSGGYFNKAVRNTISKAEANKLHAVLWDVVDYQKWLDGFDETPYNQRFDSLVNILTEMNDMQMRVSLVESETVSTHAECQKFYEHMLEQGYEGAMMKIATMPWQAKRSKFILKLKETKDATLLCVGVQAHSKNENLIGSLECVTSDFKLRVSIGAGLSEEDRKQNPEHFLNKLIDMQYNMLINSKNSSEYSMFLPRYMGIRLDQNEADSLEKLQ